MYILYNLIVLICFLICFKVKRCIMVMAKKTKQTRMMMVRKQEINSDLLC